jgi:glycosyltransferase involved in cell wall biosynthesis
VSFVIPVYNGARWLERVLDAVLAQADGRPFEVIAVEDGSSDASPAILERYRDEKGVRVVAGPRRGATAALNVGIRAASQPIICQVDQDVVLAPGWMSRLVAALADPAVGAAQGYYAADPASSPWARAMGFDLEERYSRISGAFVDHVCTGNSAYRAEALHRVGLFDETLGYGYDNDMSYRLVDGGYRLAFCREARSHHHWREGAGAYLRQQYGFGFGRLDVVAKHRRRYRGDDVSDLRMILHVPVMLLVCAAFAGAGLQAALARPSWHLAALAAALLAALVIDRLWAGIAACIRFRTTAGLLFVPVHLLRDLAWVVAVLMWASRRLLRRPTRPTDSM